MIVVSDTSPLSGLAIVGHLSLLHTLYGQLIIPTAVARELRRGGQDDPRIVQLLTLSWLEIKPPSNGRLVDELQTVYRLDKKADEPTTDELATLAVRGSSFDYISDEPDLYSSELTKGSIAMSPLVEQILQAVQDLPEADQRQVLNFIEFLIAQHQKLTHIEPDTASQ